MLWYDEDGSDRFLPALDVPDDRVVDTNGAGDIFHGAYVSFGDRPAAGELAGALRLRPRGLGPRGPASRQRGEPADAGRHRRDASPLPREGAGTAPRRRGG